MSKVPAVANAEEHELQIMPAMSPNRVQAFEHEAGFGIEAHRRVNRHVRDRVATFAGAFAKNVRMTVASR